MQARGADAAYATRQAYALVQGTLQRQATMLAYIDDFRFLAVAILLSAPLLPAKESLSADDIAKIRQVHKQYEDTWLKGDANGVRALIRRTTSGERIKLRIVPSA